MDPKGEVAEASGIDDSDEAGAEVAVVDGRLDEANGHICGRKCSMRQA